MKTNETIDILIPAYNAEKYIELCLDSLLNQTYNNVRIVVAEDGSKDGSLALLQEYAKKYKNVEVYPKQNEANISKTRNFLLTKIKSKYFTFFDIDDYAEPTYIETLYTTLTSYNADISICGRVRHYENKAPNITKILESDQPIMFFNKQEALAELISSNLFNGSACAKLYRSKFLTNVDFDPNIHYGEDLDFCFKIMNNCERFVYSPKPLYHYIIRKNSLVTSKFNLKKVTCVDCYQKIIDQVADNKELLTCAKSMQGLIAIEILYYTWRDKYKDKTLKKRLKSIIKESIPHIKKNKRLTKLYRCTPAVWWLTKFM